MSEPFRKKARKLADYVTTTSAQTTQPNSQPTTTTSSEPRTQPHVEGCPRIILILDESGSMENQKHGIITGVNDMIREQQAVDPANNHQIRFTVVKFNDTVNEVRDDLLSVVEPFNQNDYRPGGCTRLNDAIGQTLEKYKAEQNVCVCIATDGMENASRQYNHSQVKNMTIDRKEQQGWTFIYLSEDIDTFEQGNSMGITSNIIGGTYNTITKKGCLGSTLGSSENNNLMTSFRSKASKF